MAKTIKRPTTATPARKQTRAPATPDPRVEEVFTIFRDMGDLRTYRSLELAVKVRWPANPVALSTLSLWAKKYDWTAMTQRRW